MLKRLIPALIFLACLWPDCAPAQCPGNYKDAFEAYNAGDIGTALGIFDCLAEAFPGNIGNFINRGICLVKLNEFELGLMDFDHALEIYKQNPFTNLPLPPYQELATRKDRPLEDYQYPIFVYPQSFCHYLKGEVYFNMAEYRLSIQEYTKAIALYPLNKDAFVNRGLMFLREGKLSEGYSDLKYAANQGHSIAQEVLKFYRVTW